MPNHYHLVLKHKPTGSISSFLRTTFNTYTQAINSRFSTSGTLFQGEAKAKQIVTNAYCIQVICYVHLNPVTAKLVDRPEDWKFSNYREWINKRRTPLVDFELRDSFFSNPTEYQEFMNEYRSEKDQQEIGELLLDAN
jgi:putative transposase